jgi:uncharacterized phiE125 gp8 family phage protein
MPFHCSKETAMKRAIVAPAIVAGAALDELKEWLAITTPRDDAVLTSLLHSALEMCEAFTGQMPLEALCEEVLAASGFWQSLQTRPVQAVAGIEALLPDATRFPLPSQDYAIDLDANGGARVRLLRQSGSGRIAVRFTAGMTASWAALPDSLRQGILRLAAHHYTQRSSEATDAAPPAAVAALWRPWRRLRLI